MNLRTTAYDGKTIETRRWHAETLAKHAGRHRAAVLAHLNITCSRRLASTPKPGRNALGR